MPVDCYPEWSHGRSVPHRGKGRGWKHTGRVGAEMEGWRGVSMTQHLHGLEGRGVEHPLAIAVRARKGVEDRGGLQPPDLRPRTRGSATQHRIAVGPCMGGPCNSGHQSAPDEPHNKDCIRQQGNLPQSAPEAHSPHRHRQITHTTARAGW